MRRAFERLYGRIKPGSVVLVFFSGHGLQSNRQSYMIPVDAQIWNEADVRREGFSLETVLGEINNRGAGVKIALIDASRRNPFERRFRSFSAGLAPVTAPSGTLMMYSAALSSVISENGGDHSVFVQELLKQIRVSDQLAEETLNLTRVGVTRASRGEQVPWISSSLAEDFAFNGRPSVAARPGLPAPTPMAAPRPAPPPVTPALPIQAAPTASQVAALPQVSPPPSATDFGHRIALVIGNDRYQNLAADQQLANAINDARAVKATLEGLRFEVIYGENLDRRSLVDRLFDLAARLGKDDIAFFYFAGHGVSFNGANYLLPTDIPTPHASGRAEEARLADQAIAESQVIERITGSGARVAIVVLDACRNNPLRGTDTRAIGGSRGLSLGQPAQGVFTIYSAGFGQEALDRLGPDDHNPNSVFTRVFIEKLKTPGLDLKAIATETRRTVVELAQKIGQNQFPAYYDQISSDVYLAGSPAR
jgi:uncharacterized caspase-like protein